ncbi:MAG: hypothetical protein KDC38_00885 [Planctomycetes bacterium]|nr:hypothetical protein [Planctomycetota bacterium]
MRTWPVVSIVWWIGLGGCATVDFIPEPRVEFGLAPELEAVTTETTIHPWFLDPPATIHHRRPVYYALEISDGTGTDQWLLRVVPTADRVPSFERIRPEQGAPPADEGRAIGYGLLRGLTAEFGEHSGHWVDELEQSTRTYDMGFASATDLVPVFVDALGPARTAPGGMVPNEGELHREGSLRWVRVEQALPVVAPFFEGDFPAACRGALRLANSGPESISSTERHEILSAIVRAKLKLAQGLFMILRSDTLKRLADRVLERPSVIAYTSAAARWLTSSRAGFIEWIASNAGIRFDRSVPSAEDPSLTLFRFEPTLATTSLVKTEITAAPTADAPLLSAGFVTIQGINPYDSTKKFRLRLLGWSEAPTDGGALLSTRAELRFGPQGRTLANVDGTELWILPREPDGAPLALAARNWSSGDWSPSGDLFIARLGEDSHELEVVDLESWPELGRSARYSSVTSFEISSDDRTLTIERSGAPPVSIALHSAPLPDPGTPWDSEATARVGAFCAESEIHSAHIDPHHRWLVGTLTDPSGLRSTRLWFLREPTVLTQKVVE